MMEKKKTSNSNDKQGKRFKKTSPSQNRAQNLAKQRLQKDLQKQLVESRKKVAAQIDSQETDQEQTPESTAIQTVEQVAVQGLEEVFQYPLHHKEKNQNTKARKVSPAETTSTPATSVPHNSKLQTIQEHPYVKSMPSATKQQRQTTTTVNPAMKRWAQQRMIAQKQKIRMDTKMEAAFTESIQPIQPEPIKTDISPSVSSPISPKIHTDDVISPTASIPEASVNLNQHAPAPNTAWAHTFIQKKQDELRKKHHTLRVNQKEEIYPTTQAASQKHIQSQSINSENPTASHFPTASSTTQQPSNKIQKKLQLEKLQSDILSGKNNVYQSDMPVPDTHTTSFPAQKKKETIKSPSSQQSRSASRSGSAGSSGYQKSLQTRFLKDWQRKAHEARFSPYPPATGRTGRNVWQQIQNIAHKVKYAAQHSGALGMIFLVALMFLLLFGAVGGLVTSPFGVFFSSQETSPEARSVRAAIAETNNEYFNELDGLIRNTKHDTLVVHQIPAQQIPNDTQIHNWEEILAVFAVQTTTDGQSAMDVVKLDDKRIKKLKEIFWKMVSIDHQTKTTGKGDKQKTTLTITIRVKSAEQMAEELHFSKVQKGALDELLANRAWLTELVGQATGSGGGHGSGEYEIPPEALGDEKFKAMITEAQKYLGYPYVWGGSNPSTSFDCSGFVSWVINKSGVGNVGRETAQGLYNRCVPISKAQAKPGDLVFFTKTYSTSNPVTHVGIFVGDNKMIHCGNPIQYTSIGTSYWQKHFYSFGRF